MNWYIRKYSNRVGIVLKGLVHRDLAHNGLSLMKSMRQEANTILNFTALYVEQIFAYEPFWSLQFVASTDRLCGGTEHLS